MSNNTVNPWNTDLPFAPFFCDEVQFPVTASRAGDPTSRKVSACVFPIDDVDPLTDSTTENKAKKVNALVLQSDLPQKPVIGDSFTYASATWEICEVDREMTWYKLVARGGLR